MAVLARVVQRGRCEKGKEQAQGGRGTEGRTRETSTVLLGVICRRILAPLFGNERGNSGKEDV
jgi:hypothetical protein